MGETLAYPFAFLGLLLTPVGFVSFCFLTGVLLYVSYADMRWRIIPNRAVFAAACFWLFLVAAECLAGEPARAAARFLTGAAGAVFLGGFALLSATVLDRALSKDSLGGGDVKLLAAMGLYLGPEAGLSVLFFACVFMLALAVLAVVLGRSASGPYPFAPFLTCGVLFAALVGV